MAKFTVAPIEPPVCRWGRIACVTNSHQSTLLQALSGQRPDRLPVWFMRQAGRSLPEYREVREGNTILQACLMPELAAEITLQPVRRHGVDAAIFFSDIMVPLVLAGVDVDIQPGIGPVVADPVRSAADVDRLVDRGLGDAEAITSAVRMVVAELGEQVPLIGFAGAPFTLAAYLVEGRGSRDHLAARALMHADPAAWHRLLGWCAELSASFLEVQVDAGARVVQLFDSWAGSLRRDDYAEHVAPHSRTALAAVAGRVPRIHFGTGTRHLLPDMAACGVEAMGIDYRTPLDDAAGILPGLPLQGNIDPAMLAAGWGPLERHVRDVVERGRKAPAHIVNLGHGVPPTTDPGVLTELVGLVHEL
ncbi:uroporphyrinogen decarboxylase [Tessaracoccus sp. OS52]|uniref:uroporphyrinogen decarboxylase n=1 Tax=Tessaracoccus sp. OS52 TaxID=2886691 RepID=UPI001D129743|nr:uroporphyrinogen decarboxylase [Tessaracoccus sp. OS52]MCC2592636.1 uroporphyrinogen decarboxylase [Tessaracoccus sp. OS52]